MTSQLSILQASCQVKSRLQKAQTEPAPPKKASARAVLDLSVAVIQLYFRLEAATQAIAGFASAGGEWGVLHTLSEEGPGTVPAIARSRPVSRQHCQIICNALEAQGFVEFIANPLHKRSQLVRITRKGRTRYKAMTDQFLAAAAIFAPNFEARDMETTTKLLRKARALLVV
jgi:DNA-binding MarR family transcriptional regulator